MDQPPKATSTKDESEDVIAEELAQEEVQEEPSPQELKESEEEAEELKKGHSKLKDDCKVFVVPNEAVKKVTAKKEGTNEDEEKFIIDPEHVKDRTPLLVFINKKSGGQQGNQLISKLKSLLHECQVFDLGNGGPAPGLETYRHIPNARIWVCGGDGTVGWVLMTIDKLKITNPPPVAVLPLGTGNDLARSLRWGGGYRGEKIVPILKDVGIAKESILDRWSLKISNKDADTGNYSESKQVNVMNNYFSVGIDAGIALEFHEKREAHPEKFKSRTINKINYTAIGGKAMFSHHALYKDVEIEVDGKKIELPHDIEGLCVLNLSSYMGGTNLWGTKNSSKFKPQTASDGLMEVVSVNGSFHLGAIKARLSSAKRLAQGKDVKISIFNNTIPVQVDGEPWRQGPSIIHIDHLNQAKMLCKLKSIEKKSLSKSNNVSSSGNKSRS